jgi:hypothetical protein
MGVTVGAVELTMIGSVNAYSAVATSYRTDNVVASAQTASTGQAATAATLPGISYFSPESKFDQASQKVILVFVSNETGAVVNQMPSAQQIAVYRRQAAAVSEQRVQAATQMSSVPLARQGAGQSSGAGNFTSGGGSTFSNAPSAVVQFTGGGNVGSMASGGFSTGGAITSAPTPAAPAPAPASAAPMIPSSMIGSGSAQIVSLSA